MRKTKGKDYPMVQKIKLISGIFTAVTLFSNIMYGDACAEKYISVNSPCYPMKCSAEYETHQRSGYEQLEWQSHDKVLWDVGHPDH